MDETRYCPECDKDLPLSEFYADKRTKAGLTRRCKKHHSAKSYESRLKKPRDYRPADLKRKYNMTVEDWYNMFIKQEGRCAICGFQEMSLSNRGQVRLLSVDHDHATGQIRGLLCSKCNVGLGNFDDNVNILRLAVKYLEQFQS